MPFRCADLMALALAGVLLAVGPAWAADVQVLQPPSLSLAAELEPVVGENAIRLDPEDSLLAEDRRHHQLQLHQGLALATLTTMALAAGMGTWSAHGFPDRNLGTALHAGLGGVATGLYFASAALSLTAPAAEGDPVAVGGPWDSVDVHRALAWGHGAAMVLTVASGVARLSGRLDNEPHQAVGLTALALMSLSAGVLALVP